MLFDPGDAEEHLPFALPCGDFRIVNYVVHLIFALSRRYHFSLRLRPIVLNRSVLNLWSYPRRPRVLYPVAGLPSGTGITPVGINDLAWPH